MARPAKIAQGDDRPLPPPGLAAEAQPQVAAGAPGETACFPGPAIDAASLADELIGEYRRLAGGRADNPFANPVLLLAHELSRRPADGPLAHPAVEQLVQHLTAAGFQIGRRSGWEEVCQ